MPGSESLSRVISSAALVAKSRLDVGTGCNLLPPCQTRGWLFTLSTENRAGRSAIPLHMNLQSGDDFWQELVPKIPFCLFGCLGKVWLRVVACFVTLFSGVGRARRTLLSSK